MVCITAEAAAGKGRGESLSPETPKPKKTGSHGSSRSAPSLVAESLHCVDNLTQRPQGNKIGSLGNPWLLVMSKCRHPWELHQQRYTDREGPSPETERSLSPPMHQTGNNRVALNWHGTQCCPQGVLEKPWRGWGGEGGEMAWVTHGLAADLLRPCSHWLWP